MRIWLILKIILHPVRYAQDKIDAWVLARVKRQPGPVPVPRYRVYIVPTSFGYGFGILLVVMLMGAMNYSNNMAFALTFLLAGLGLIAMHHTHANLVNVEISAGAVEPVFAGETAHFEVHLRNAARRVRYSLSSGWPRKPVSATTDVAPESIATLKLPVKAERRGWLPAGVFAISTEFPLGMFHAWTWLELEMSCLVYPMPAPPGKAPPATSGSSGAQTGPRPGLDEFAGLRNYQRGDTPRSIHWKSFPKLRKPMVKQFQETLEQELWLDWDELSGLEAEARLSQLTRWVLEAEASQLSYGLRLPGASLSPGRGAPHRDACLKTLALYQLGSMPAKPRSESRVAA